MFSTSCFQIIAFLGLWAVIWLPFAILVARLIGWQPTQPLTVKKKLILLASLYILAPVIIWWKTRSGSISLNDLGLNWQLSTLTSVGWGLIISLVGLATVFSLESLFNLVIWHWHKSRLLWSSIVPISILSLGISFIEELVFRGYVINILKADYSYWIAATISSVIFALLHLIWERKTTIPQLPGLWLMGMVLAGARSIDNGNLGLAWGLHSGWILGLSCIDSAQLITYNEKAQSWIIGIYQQPLAGIAGIFCMLATAVVLWFLSPILITF